MLTISSDFLNCILINIVKQLTFPSIGVAEHAINFRLQLPITQITSYSTPQQTPITQIIHIIVGNSTIDLDN